VHLRAASASDTHSGSPPCAHRRKSTADKASPPPS
jgi:hypothetical protein